MTFDLDGWRKRHPRWLKLVVFLKSARTKVGFLVALACFADGLVLWEPPFSLIHPNRSVWIGALLILVGVALRLAAYGSIKKKEALVTTGVYSLCRHPLYLGSMLITYGFCFLLDDLANWIAATLYFLVFYTVTIVWEEIRLAQRYGAAHEAYCREVPLLLPLGRIRPDGFHWTAAVRNGGVQLIGMILFLLTTVEIMAETMRH